MCRIIGRAFEALRAGTTFSPKLLRCFCADRDSRQAPHHPAIRIAGSNSLAAARLQHAPERGLENIRRRAQPRIHQARLTPHSRAQPPGVSEQAWSDPQWPPVAPGHAAPDSFRHHSLHDGPVPANSRRRWPDHPDARHRARHTHRGLSAIDSGRHEAAGNWRVSCRMARHSETYR